MTTATKVGGAVVVVALAALAAVTVPEAIERADVESRVTLRGDTTRALLMASVEQCGALVSPEGHDKAVGDSCPGDEQHVEPEDGARALRTMGCLQRDGYVTDWHAELADDKTCVVDVRSKSGVEAWRWTKLLDGTGLELVAERPSERDAKGLRSGCRSHVWMGEDPCDNGDDREPDEKVEGAQ